jgi:hypothetical protein
MDVAQRRLPQAEIGTTGTMRQAGAQTNELRHTPSMSYAAPPMS